MLNIYKFFLKLTHEKRRTWRLILTALASVVVFATTYAMMIPAITIDRETAEAEPGIVLDDVDFDGALYEEDIFEENAPDTWFEDDWDAETEYTDDSWDDSYTEDEWTDNDDFMTEDFTTEEFAEEDITAEENDEFIPENDTDPEELIADIAEEYLILREAHDGTFRAMAADGSAVDVEYDEAANTAAYSDLDDVIWTFDGYHFENAGTFLNVSASAVGQRAIADVPVEVMMNPVVDNRTSIYTTDDNSYNCLVLSDDQTYFTAIRIESEPVNRVILAYAGEATFAAEEETAEENFEDSWIETENEEFEPEVTSEDEQNAEAWTEEDTEAAESVEDEMIEETQTEESEAEAIAEETESIVEEIEGAEAENENTTEENESAVEEIEGAEAENKNTAEENESTVEEIESAEAENKNTAEENESAVEEIESVEAENENTTDDTESVVEEIAEAAESTVEEIAEAAESTVEEIAEATESSFEQAESVASSIPTEPDDLSVDSCVESIPTVVVEEIAEPAAADTQTVTGPDYKITVSWTEEAGIPAGASLEVFEITQDTQIVDYAAETPDDNYYDDTTSYNGNEYSNTDTYTENELSDSEFNTNTYIGSELTDSEYNSAVAYSEPESTNTAINPDTEPDDTLIYTEKEPVSYDTYVTEAAETLGLEPESVVYVRLFDISIVDSHGNHLKPEAHVSVEISLLDTDGTPEDFSVVHFNEELGQPEQMETETDGSTFAFTTDSFSAYAIVQGPSAESSSWQKLTTMDELSALSSHGLYIGTTGGFYLTDTTAIGSQDKNTTGIVKTKPAQTYPADGAAKYYFEEAEGEGHFYVYCLDENGTRNYVRNTGDANLYLTADETERTAFYVQVDGSGRFRMNNGSRYWNMWNGANGNHIAAWTTANDGNNYFYIWNHLEVTGDPYGLDGATYGLMYWMDGTLGKAMMGSTTGNNLDALALTVMAKKGNNGDKLFVPDNSDITLWNFKWAEDDKYYISTVADGMRQYLKIEAGRISLTTEKNDSCKIQVMPGSGTHEGQICLRSGNTALTYSGDINTGFKMGGSAGTEWLNLVEVSELTSDYFMTHSARKVSVSDENVTNGSRIIVYTRVWNDAAKKYEFYAVDHDGSLVRCYESGDDIQWVGPRLNSLLWNFVEHYWEGTTDPNHYYDLYNQYSENYIAPQVTDGQTLSGSPIGLNMNGRRDGQYYSEIVAWDDPNYAYVGLRADVETGRIVSCPRSEADDFYFAVMQDIPVDDELHTVATVDSARHGITMKMTDFGTRSEMSNFLGSDAGGAVNNTDAGLLSTKLGTNGYPTTKAGNDLSSWFSSARDVNHLFIQSTYSASGYFEYDSTQNFASLKGSDFVVYQEIGTVNNSGVHYQHGQFFPYNDLKAGIFASTSPKNLTTAGGSALSESDPRKYEQLYLVQNQNYYLGMEIEASFTQTPNGEDDWGHDIIYEFTGDDDFWLYVDGELIIDLGGIHNALSGSVNYKTGDVYVNGTHHTLRELFESNYRSRNSGASDAEVAEYLAQYFDEGSTIFGDFTNHTMKIFYLERGAGASNLHMRFNLASVKPGTVELTKKLSGVDMKETILAEFPYQIRYKKGNTEYYLYNEVPHNADKNTDYVFYKDTTSPVTYHESITIDGITYHDVFMLKPGETATIHFPEGMETYSVVECGVNTDVYRSVSVNGISIEGTADAGSGSYPMNRKDFGTTYESTENRARVEYTNEVDPDAIRTITLRKKLYDETGENDISNEDTTGFNFRLYMGTELQEEPGTAAMHTYHVKDSEGNYCTWDAENQAFVTTGINNYSDLSDEQKTAAGFTTSLNGSISKIPAGYTVEIRNVLAGTKFKVVERPTEIPDGYSFQKYEYFEDGLAAEATGVALDALEGISDVVEANKDPHTDICNLKGWGIRVNKVWTDADYMTEREDAYFAVFAKMADNSLTLVDGTVRRMDYDAKPQSLYWYFDHLPVAGTSGLDDYVVREITLENPTVDENGNIDYSGDVNVIGEGGEIVLEGKQKGERSAAEFHYTVSYQEGVISQGSNVRVDTVTNGRPGIVLKKTDWSGKALAGATFTLRDNDDNVIGTYTSDEEGMITTAFLGSGKTYTLTETKTPKQYRGMEVPMEIRWENGKVSVKGADPNYYTVTQAPATITIKNRSFTLKVVKTDGDSERVLAGVKFALHKQHAVDGVVQFDPVAMDGYAALVTGEDGVVPKVDETLPAGTYELREIEGKNGYETLGGHVHFAISEAGVVSLGEVPEGVKLAGSVDEAGGVLDYVIRVPNYRKTDVVLKKTDESGRALAGAQFTLCRYNTNTWEAVSEYGEIDMTEMAEVQLSGMKTGLYRLTETRAPKGYVILTNHVYFRLEVNAEGETVVTLTDEAGTGENANEMASAEGNVITVKNMAGVALPATGGPGTGMFTLAGLLLVVLVGVMLVVRRRA